MRGGCGHPAPLVDGHHQVVGSGAYDENVLEPNLSQKRMIKWRCLGSKQRKGSSSLCLSGWVFARGDRFSSFLPTNGRRKQRPYDLEIAEEIY